VDIDTTMKESIENLTKLPDVSHLIRLQSGDLLHKRTRQKTLAAFHLYIDTLFWTALVALPHAVHDHNEEHLEAGNLRR
jgi:hypothetical protein